MALLPRAPLVEVIFELRWGNRTQAPGGNEKIISFNFSSEEINFLPGQFKEKIASHGFGNLEEANPGIISVPHVVKHRFRKGPGAWPCYQIGLGIFTANQVNEGYSWKKFLETIVIGVETLDASLPKKLKRVPALSAELRYQDALRFSRKEGSLRFLKDRLNLGSVQVDTVLDNPMLSKSVEGVLLAFQVKCRRPSGMLVLNLAEGAVKGEDAFILNIALRSSDKDVPKFTVSALRKWANDAHLIQKDMFKKILTPELMATYSRG